MRCARLSCMVAGDVVGMKPGVGLSNALHTVRLFILFCHLLELLYAYDLGFVSIPVTALYRECRRVIKVALER